MVFISRGSNYLYKLCLFFIINFNHHIKGQNVNFWNAEYALIMHCHGNVEALQHTVAGQGLSAKTHLSKKFRKEQIFILLPGVIDASPELTFTRT